MVSTLVVLLGVVGMLLVCVMAVVLSVLVAGWHSWRGELGWRESRRESHRRFLETLPEWCETVGWRPPFDTRLGFWRYLWSWLRGTDDYDAEVLRYTAGGIGVALQATDRMRRVLENSCYRR